MVGVLTCHRLHMPCTFIHTIPAKAGISDFEKLQGKLHLSTLRSGVLPWNKKLELCF